MNSEELSPYYLRRTELSLKDGCVLWGARVLIPAPGRAGILQELHVTHPGVSRMKALASSYVYWLGIDVDKDIESLVSDCNMSGTPKCSTKYGVTPVGVAGQALVPSTCRFCRTVPRAYVPDISGCPLQVDGHLHYVQYYVGSDDW